MSKQTHTSIRRRIREACDRFGGVFLKKQREKGCHFTFGTSEQKTQLNVAEAKKKFIILFISFNKRPQEGSVLRK